MSKSKLVLFCIVAAVGWIALGVGVTGFLMWANDNSSHPGESWEDWSARIDRYGQIQNSGLLVAGVFGIFGLLIPRRDSPRALKLFAAAPLVASIAFFAFVMIALIGLGIR